MDLTTNEAITRVAQEAGWPAPTPASITRMIQTPEDERPARHELESTLA